MLGTEKGEMYHLLIRESMGGSAGHYNGWPCTGANFYYDRNGEIIKFTNYPLDDPDIYRGTFRIAVDPRGRCQTLPEVFFKIIDCYTDKRAPPHANRIIEETAGHYNVLALLSLIL